MVKILAINGSYRLGGIIDQAVSAAIESARAAGTEVEYITLRDYPIEFCLNCVNFTRSFQPFHKHVSTFLTVNQAVKL